MLSFFPLLVVFVLAANEAAAEPRNRRGLADLESQINSLSRDIIPRIEPRAMGLSSFEAPLLLALTQQASQQQLAEQQQRANLVNQLQAKMENNIREAVDTVTQLAESTNQSMSAHYAERQKRLYDAYNQLVADMQAESLNSHALLSQFIGDSSSIITSMQAYFDRVMTSTVERAYDDMNAMLTRAISKIQAVCFDIVEKFKTAVPTIVDLTRAPGKDRPTSSYANVIAQGLDQIKQLSENFKRDVDTTVSALASPIAPVPKVAAPSFSYQPIPTVQSPQVVAPFVVEAPVAQPTLSIAAAAPVAASFVPQQSSSQINVAPVQPTPAFVEPIVSFSAPAPAIVSYSAPEPIHMEPAVYNPVIEPALVAPAPLAQVLESVPVSAHTVAALSPSPVADAAQVVASKIEEQTVEKNLIETAKKLLAHRGRSQQAPVYRQPVFPNQPSQQSYKTISNLPPSSSSVRRKATGNVATANAGGSKPWLNPSLHRFNY